ncbi:MAG: protein translocase subunit SecD [Chthonomonadales bacterium]
MKNLQTRLLLLIIALVAGSAYIIATRPTRLGLDIQGGMRVVLHAEKDKLPKSIVWDSGKLQAVADIIHHRVDALGVAEPLVSVKSAEDQIIVELPGLTNREEARKSISSTARLEFRGVPELDNGTWTTRPAKAGGSGAEGTDYEEIINATTKMPISDAELEGRVFSKEPLLAGDKLKSNSRADIGTGKPVIHFEFQDDAKDIFKDYTRAHIGKRLAVFLDRKLITAPTVNDVIPGTGIIEGSFTAESAKALADQLNAGALPVPLTEEQVVNVEATLGKQAVKQTLMAGVVGLGLVLVFMLYWYKMPGVLASLALGLYTLFSLAIFKGALGYPITLTVPGIAGFILSIGMAVDANILIFERMKEERASGKTLMASIEVGFKRAFTAIADSNICTLITCFILYWFGTGQVKGFALTLAIGVAVSMFTAITCSRTFLLLVAGTPFGQNDKIYGLTGGLHPKLNVTKKTYTWFAISLAILVPGVIFWGMGGIKKSIEFTGGTEISVQFAASHTASQVQSALEAVGQKDARVQMAQDNRSFITTRKLDDTERNNVIASLRTKVGGFATETVTDVNKKKETRDIVGFSNVSGTISAELTRNAILAVFFASVMIILYLSFRFAIPNFMEGLKFGTCAVAALIHDVGVLWGGFAIFGYFLNWQIDSLFVTAMLTVIGFSVHDTIIIFDRIRENLKNKTKGETFDEVADRSIEQTFARSVRTSWTVVLTLLALLFAGGPVVRLFVTALLIGIVSGTYSSIFNATPLLALWKRKVGEAAVVTATAAAAARASVTPKPVAKPVAAPVATTPSGEEGESAAAARIRANAKKRPRRG